MKKLWAFALASLLAAGCVHAPGGIAASTVPVEGRRYQVLGRTAGTDSYILLFGFLPIFGSNSTREAVEDALERKGADALIGVTVDTYTHYWILFSRSVISVEGTAIKFE